MGATYPISFKITNAKSFIGEGEKSVLKPAYRVGQLIFVEDTGKIYLDFHDKRVCYTGVAPASDANSLHYIGIAEVDPTDTTQTLTIKGMDTYTPTKNDVIVYGAKEYLYRVGSDGNYGWFELGDDEATTLSWEGDEE